MNYTTNNINLWRAIQLAQASPELTIRIVGASGRFLKKLNEFTAQFATVVDADADMTVEYHLPTADELMETVRSDVDVYRRGPCQPATELESAAIELLKVAYSRLSLDLADVESIIKIAGISAALDGYKTIAAMHIAEAIQYNEKSLT